MANEKIFLALVIGFISGYLARYIYSKLRNPSKDYSNDLNKTKCTYDYSRDRIKLILCVRTDLGMTKGKAAAQCGHATLAAYRAVCRENPDLLKAWEMNGEMKVTVKVDSEEKLLALKSGAKKLGLFANIIQDAGHTQIPWGSRTVLAVGPGESSKIDQLTGDLSLY